MRSGPDTLRGRQDLDLLGQKGGRQSLQLWPLLRVDSMQLEGTEGLQGPPEGAAHRPHTGTEARLSQCPVPGPSAGHRVGSHRPQTVGPDTCFRSAPASFLGPDSQLEHSDVAASCERDV